jgi:hypothetical protein
MMNRVLFHRGLARSVSYTDLYKRSPCRGWGGGEHKREGVGVGWGTRARVEEGGGGRGDWRGEHTHADGATHLQHAALGVLPVAAAIDAGRHARLDQGVRSQLAGSHIARKLLNGEHVPVRGSATGAEEGGSWGVGLCVWVGVLGGGGYIGVQAGRRDPGQAARAGLTHNTHFCASTVRREAKAGTIHCQ